MELNPTPFPVKSKYMTKAKAIRKNPDDQGPKRSAKTGPPPPLLSQKRVFGTARNPNIPLKPALEKPKAKPSSRQPKVAANPPQTTPPGLPISEAKKLSGKSRTETKNKSVCFQENEAQKNEKLNEPQTPLKSPAIPPKPRLSATPYHTAERCSKCRFDKLETSAYWLGQIKLSESVGRHFVSADFFKLALECKAEPIRNIRVELKKYLARHEYLNGAVEWKNLAIGFGLMKDNRAVIEGDQQKAADEIEANKDLENETADKREENKDLQNENC